MAAKSATGLNKNTAGALAYVLGPITGVIFLVIDKDPFVRFHAMQSIVVLGGLFVLRWILLFAFLPMLYMLAKLAWFVLMLILVYKAWQGEEWEVPYLGKFARKMVKKA